MSALARFRDSASVVREADRVLFRNYKRAPVAFSHGRGVRLFDLEGREYLDFIGGIAVSSLGHAHPALVAALADQAARYIHVSNLYQIPEQVAAAERLVAASGLPRAFFCNSGAEANEAAIKLARRYGARQLGGRYEILTTYGSFHGRTIATISATAQEKYQSGFQPLLQGFRYVPFGDVEAMAQAVREETVAILVEPIQGEGGVNVPPEGYLRRLRELCDRKRLLLMLDEVQVGMGRTGTLFAHEQDGIRPDIVTIAKALGGGVPIGAMLTIDEIAQALDTGAHGSTFGGNPLACAAGVAVLETIAAERLLDNCRAIGARLHERLARLAAELPMIRQVRGRGLILGVELDRPGRPLVGAALERGLVINCTAETVIRLLPPLTLSAAEADEGLAILEGVLRAAS
ncbi:MAG TPA: acetylornithine transaminase [Thermoanaerobaculia bacterium]|nr:acetylornithine transaminase [Thermoanaerobaculia bacterium]